MFYFDPNGQAPITLMELGIASQLCYENIADVVVCCPDGFWRKGNVEMVCDRYCVPLFNTIDELIEQVKAKYESRHRPV